MSALIGRAVLIDHIAEDQHFAGAKDIGGRPVEGAPIHGKAQVALALRGEAADGRAVEGEIVPALDQELLVVVEHVQPAFQVAEQHGHGLDALLIGQITDPLFLNLMRRDARCAAPLWRAGSGLPVRHMSGSKSYAVRLT